MTRNGSSIVAFAVGEKWKVRNCTQPAQHQAN